LRRQAAAFDVFEKDSTQQDSYVARDVDENWDKWGIPLGTPRFFKNIIVFQYIVKSLIQLAHQELAHRLFIGPGIKEEPRLRVFGKGRHRTLIIMPFVKKN